MTRRTRWQTLCTLGALAVMVIFVIFFRNPAKAKSHDKDVIAGRKEENLEMP